ncbi:hypothetical protein DV096_09450 [Bradymonadaceae bacterium TMQ3]|uniref:Biopolymer transporter ExbD n=1 Tax=Lujinxingia sediminis TaxID=2480984 RepID=A0ABY0CQG2_9DELT|nr:biopolymer transporter ExbD [Lujinxingia sediminis]RDV38030.1 hypothetical protein DV096_09450 [Bradymonadaceae bacterium TMQ3]RVU42300.1 hypothetical protein EA187_17080 [Lujinxingia sediminis]TXC75701.1 hypothetical protein FRC91_09355 [Bradymonadales bacterium TMQ1]
MAENQQGGFGHDDEEWIKAQRAREAKRAKSAARRGDDDGPGLNINSLMDILVIMLVFLLKSYGEEPLKAIDEDLKVPQSASQLAPEDATTVTVTRTAILVNDSLAVDVKDGAVDPSQKSGGGESGMSITPLLDELNRAVEQKKNEQRLLQEDYVPEATIIADQTTPHRLMLEVLFTASQAQLNQFRFAVIKSTFSSLGGQPAE